MASESYMWEILEVINWIKFTLRELILPTTRNYETILFDGIDEDENEDNDIIFLFSTIIRSKEKTIWLLCLVELI